MPVWFEIGEAPEAGVRRRGLPDAVEADPVS